MRRINQGLIYGMAALLAAGALWTDAQSTRADDPAIRADANQTVEKVAIPSRKADQVRGFSMQLYFSNGKFDTEKYIKAVDEIADLGCTWINFSVAARQQDARSASIPIDYSYMPLPGDLQRIFARAKQRGMGVMLMPIVLLIQTGAKDWRGVILPAGDPPRWDDWFASYTHYILQMARIADEGNVDIFCVGSELLSTEEFTGRWERIIEQIRAVYKGKLTYSANWDHYDHVKFWNKLDFVGMNNYHELWDKPGATLPQLASKWDPIKKKILAFAAAQGKNGMPFMFTEVGWHNLRNTISEPWNYVPSERVINLDEQKHAYESFVETWGGVSSKQFMGAFIWEWCPGDDGEHNAGTYSLQKTPALAVVRKWFAMPQVNP